MPKYTPLRAGAVAAFVLTLSAHAQVSALGWVEVPNHVWAPTGQSPLTDPAAGALWGSKAWRTFDLTIFGPPGRRILGVQLGEPTQPQYGVNLGGASVFNHPLGADLRSFPVEPLFPAIGFDTYICFGGDDLDPGQPMGIIIGGINLAGAGGVIQAAYLSRSGKAAIIEPEGRLRILRVTVSDDFVAGVGGAGLIQIASGMGSFQDFALSPWPDVPAPGAASLLAVAALAGARRRR